MIAKSWSLGTLASEWRIEASEALLLRLIDEGNTRYRDADHLWVWLGVPGRDDNLLCAVLVLEGKVIVKTVLHRWELLP